MSDYMNLVDAVKDYYGAGSDQWLEIAKYGISGDNAYSILSQTPNVSTVVSESGEVLGYTVNEVAGIASQPAGSLINSNAQVATMTQVASTRYPAEMSLTQTGEVVATSGVKTVSTGAKVASTAGKALAVVGAVSAGIQLGAVIDSALYNANPDFWDENGMGALNPQTWDSICTTENGKKCFNMIFGIDKDTDTTQPYLDERALAYIAQYMSNKGAFSSGEGDYVTPGTYNPKSSAWQLSLQTLSDQNFALPINIYENATLNDDYYYNGSPQTIYNRKYTVLSHTAPVYMFYAVNKSGSTDYSYIAYYVSKSPFTLEDDNNGTIRTRTASSVTVDNTAYYFYNASFPHDTKLNPSGGTIATVTPAIPTNTPYIYQYADAVKLVFNADLIPSGGGVEGITKQDGATLPTGITPDMSIDDVIAYLKTTYPTLWDGAISNDVIQPDGTIKQFIYVPVGMPDTIPDNPDYGLQPTGGVGTLQSNPTIDENSPSDVVDTLIKIIGTPTPDDPTIPQDPTDIPDTGSGVTPPVVTPSGSAGALYAVYNPTQAQINNFGSWLWSSNFVEQLKKLFNDPMQSIIGLHKIFATPSTGASQNIMVGYIDSGVSSATVSNQYATVNCGTVDLYEYFGNVLDYTNTDIYLYLPFVGIVPLNVNDVTRATIGVVYKVDVLTGACLVSVNVNRDGGAGGQLYTYSGNCAVQYPLSSGSYIGIVTSILGVAGGIAGTIATGGAMLPVALGAGASALGGARTNVEHSGNLSGNAGAMGIKKPYLIIKRPQTDFAENFEIFDGRSVNTYSSISTLTGFVRARYANLENIDGATGEELSEIETLLLNGILI
jgi:hypothetical protein